MAWRMAWGRGLPRRVRVWGVCVPSDARGQVLPLCTSGAACTKIAYYGEPADALPLFCASHRSRAQVPRAMRTRARTKAHARMHAPVQAHASCEAGAWCRLQASSWCVAGDGRLAGRAL